MAHKVPVLILDKDKGFADALAERLKACGYTAAGLTSGAQFFQLSSQMKPGILLLSGEIQNPTWSELLERMKHSSLKPESMNIVLVVKEAVPALEAQARRHSIKKIIHKPLYFNELLKDIETFSLVL
jgi:FixJ family two-component response regulator